ncbi:hypothetical protein CXF96_14825 [Stenotrophomonas sp. Betaine-02u-21]|nr:hypothetical protein CXF90_12220 [Stenotrophomonas sp. Betaine-02u-23]PKH72708.1 hypothetical protein CXF96_14825 [Stenotrophomonas sp. Betaine-02u-21]PKH97117.1 hypothetical protein CXG43_03820 [Stenotrophomonas sp. Bg11-02]
MPTWWYRYVRTPRIDLHSEGGFQCTPFALLRGGSRAGESQAALRILLAITVSDRSAADFDAKLSLDELEDLTQLSRSMVLKGVRLAADHGYIAYEAGKPRTKSSFSLLQGPGQVDQGWAKAPNEEIRTRIPKLPHRGDAALASLKIYLTLLAARSRNNAVVRLKHETLRSKAGCQAKHVRSAISLLANEGLIHVLSEDESKDPIYRVQQYQICGKLDAPRRWNE